MTCSSIEEKVLRAVRPAPRDERLLRRVIGSLERGLKRAIREEGIDAIPMLVGSIAKDTHLRDTDIDLFILFPTETSREDLERQGLRIARAVMDGEERYAEHPYLHGRVEGYDVDIVPSYHISSPAERISAVDRTPFHTAYIREHLSGAQRDEVRLLKQFMKGVGVYGAEAKIQGFSGYLVELLVLRYGDLRAVLKAAQGWRREERIVLAPSTTKFDDPLIVIDPVDARRNAASAVSEQRMAEFVQAAHDYLSRPNIKFFFPKARKALSKKAIVEMMRERGTRLAALSFPAPNLTEDMLWPQARKCERRLAVLLERYGFRVLSSALLIEEEVGIVFEMVEDRLPRALRHTGPYAWSVQSQRFVQKWRASPRALSPPFLEEGRWLVYLYRKHRTPKAVLSTQSAALDLGKNLNRLIKEKGKVLSHSQLLAGGYERLLSALLDKRLPWEV
ncbi:MAG: CCA tRNA nucleotidyltransferase [Candidatus Thermoplasmatota archaeon]